MEAFALAAPSIISAVTVALITLAAKKLTCIVRKMDVLMESERNDQKAHIVSLYERCKERGYITPMELDTLNRMADSYFALGGNHYIHSVISHANKDLEICGEPIPEGDTHARQV